MRPAEVFVRELAPAEGQRLKRLSRTATQASTRQRAAILLASATLMSAPEIARMWMTDESHVRKVIHDFNRHGFDSLRPRFGGGRPRRIQADDEARIVAVAGARPDTLGVPFTRWSLSKLSRYLRTQRIEVSPAHLGRILARNGISLQRTRSWKQSPDPDYQAKAARILSLYREQPKDGVVISFDEKGPESLRPKHGRGWAPHGRPERHRATYNRRHGIRYLLGALNVHTDYLRIRPRPVRNGETTLAFMKQIRLAYPRRIRIYWIQDGLSSHWTPAIRAYADANNIELVPTPTYASYLNRIEATFGAIDEFVCKNADYLDWDAFGYALAEHVRDRNSPAERERRKTEAAKRRQHRAAKTTTQLELAA
ncbi:MAG: IS630 family transposase [Candidatus Rokuibacteriota bacterium]